MDYEAKARLLDRIFAGQIYCNVLDSTVDHTSFFSHFNIAYIVFRHPDLQIRMKADFLYELESEKAKKNGVMTEEESINIAVRQNIWSKIEESNITNYKQYIDKLSKDMELSINKYNTPFLTQVLKRKNEILVKLNKLVVKRQTITSNTVEQYAIACKNNFLVREITYLPDNTKLFGSSIMEYCNLNSATYYLSSLYEKNCKVNITHIRELARSTPWRLYYNPAKTIHCNLFSRPPQDYTEEQTLLLYWSSIYDYVYESTERPDDYVIQDDKLLDKWLDEQDKKNSKNHKGLAQVGNAPSYRKGPGMTEIFIPSSPDKAHEIEALNSPVMQTAKKKMFQRLNEKGTLNAYQSGAIFAGVS